jgi:hypothetical protein
MLNVRRGLVAVMAMVLMLAATVRAQVLDQVPGDALVVIKATNLQQVSNRLGKLFTDLGVAAFQPALRDPLGAVKAQMKITNGLDAAGDLALYVADPGAEGAHEPPVVVLIPVTDYKAFLANFGEVTTEGDVSSFKPENGEQLYAANWGKYAAVSDKRTLVSQKPAQTLKVAGVSAREMSGKDIILFANVPAIRAKVVPQLNAKREEIIAEAVKELGRNEKAKPYEGVVKAAINQALNVAEAWFRDGQAATVGLSLAGDGIGFTVVSEFTEGSYLGQNVAGIKNSNASLLGGLPKGKYLVFGGSSSDHQVAAKVVNDLLAPVEAELANVNDAGAKPIQDYVKAIKAFIAADRGQTFGLFAPQVQIGQTPLLQIVSIQNGDPAALRAAQADMMRTQAVAMEAFGVQGQPTMTIAENAKTVGGVSFNSITGALPESNDPAVLQAKQMFGVLYGPQGMVYYSAPIGSNKLLTVSGLSDEQIAAAVEAARGDAAPVAEMGTVQQIAGQLPKERVAAVYIALDEILNTGMQAAGQFGMPVNVQLPPDLPPIGATVARDGTALRVDVQVSNKLVQAIVAAGMQAFMQFQGGGQPGGPAGQ